jgi:hypothetical protein
MTTSTEEKDRSDAAVGRLLAPLREAPPSLSNEREGVLWSRLQAEMQQPARRGFALPAFAPWAGVALAGAAALAFTLTRATPESAREAPRAVPLEASPPVTGPEFATTDRTLPSGARIELHDARVQLAEALPGATRLVVEQGGVTSSVPKLKAGERYLVETPQAVVSVHGTRFTVTRTSATTTRVVVTEGLVSVDPPGWRPAFFLRPGEQAEVGPCPDAPAAAAATDPTADWRCAADGLTGLAAAATDALSRDNLRVRAGRLVGAHAPREAAALWQALLEASPEGIHAEEAAYELGAAWHAAGDTAAARAAGAEFRRRFPRSPRVPATNQF